MNFTPLKQLFHYPTFTLLLLSVCVASFLVILMKLLYEKWINKTGLVCNELGELLSLLIFPSTYQAGLKKLNKIDDYKYFLPLIKDLVGKQRSTGANFRTCFEDLRSAVHKDVQFENELRFFIKESCLQYFAYVFLSWILCFIFECGQLSLPIYYYLAMSFLHLIGFTFLFYYIGFQQKKMNIVFNAFAPQLYKVMISSDAQLHYQQDEVLTKYLPTSVIQYNNTLANLITRRNSYGVSIVQELQLLSQDFWFFWGEYWKASKQKIERVKFVLVMLIFGGAFMIILFGLSQILVAGLF